MKKILIFILCISFNVFAAGYDSVKRWKLLEDGLKTHEMLFTMEHDFIFGPKAYINSDIFTILKDAENTSTQAGADELLKKFDKTEHIGRVGLDFGIPLPSFSIGEFKFTPNLRVHGTGGFLTAMESKNFSSADAAQFIPSQLAFLKNVVANCTAWQTGLASTTPVNDLAESLNTNCPTQVAALTTLEKAALTAADGLIILPIGQDIAMNSYLNIDARFGLFFDYTYGENIFGDFAIYGLYRRDYLSAFSAGSIAAGAATPDPSKVDNATMNMSIDLSVGYKLDALSVSAGIEEIKLARITDPKEGELAYTEEALMRLHAKYELDFDFMKLIPFAGFYKRGSYDLSDGMYGGAEARLSLLNEALMFRARGTLDTTYFTFSPMFKFWVLNIDGMIKAPIKAEVDGVKPPTILGINLRFAI